MFRFTVTLKVPLGKVCAALTTVALLAVTAVPTASADDTPPSGYPSWADVQAAKDNADAKTAEIQKINGLLDGLEQQASSLGAAAVTAGLAYALAHNNLDASTAKLAALKEKTDTAHATVVKLRRQTGNLAAQDYMTGGANLGPFAVMDTLQSRDGLQKLDVMQIVAQRTTDIYNSSRAAEAVASSLDEQQAVEQAENQRLTGEAQTKLGAAQDAQRATQQKVEEEKKYSGTLTAQLAALKDTSATVEQNYRAGVEAQAAYEAQQEARQRAAAAAAAASAAAAAAAAASSPVSPRPPADVVMPDVPGGAANDPGGAQAYASGRLSSHGWGGDQMACLLKLWNQESSWMTNATNPSSGAYGVAQALPPEKYSSTGSDWLTNYRTQIDWGLGYIAGRYGSPCGAWDHETSNNWY
ncbi:coiled-coil domain-containing protein [Arthrobacter sp. 2YAF22_2]|uniref:coiled-coil domain-containing protein n=1 Tax=Arthrobacter sp. 2YAF22_2 TaxID=3233029 RepID=UPI003F91AE2D